VFLSFVDPLLVQRHLGDRAVGSTEVARLLRHRAIPAGMPVLLDESRTQNSSPSGSLSTIMDSTAARIKRRPILGRLISEYSQAP
jgi:hypothetical protein